MQWAQLAGLTGDVDHAHIQCGPQFGIVVHFQILKKALVPKAGLEPAHPFGRGILNYTDIPNLQPLSRIRSPRHNQNKQRMGDKREPFRSEA